MFGLLRAHSCILTEERFRKKDLKSKQVLANDNKHEYLPSSL